MKKNSNTYVILYSAIMVILVAVGLAFTSESLKDKQTKNVNSDTMRQILRSLRMNPSLKESEVMFNDIITEAYLVNESGEIVPGSEGIGVKDKAFATSLSELKVKDGRPGTTEFPVFVANVDGEKKYILGMYGAGLWGPIWGYIALNDDANTVYGINLDHASETPGLGAEITTDRFRKQFEGKKIYNEGELRSIAVVKPSAKISGQDRVDGISGGTLTSKGVNSMLSDALNLYKPYLETLRK